MRQKGCNTVYFGTEKRILIAFAKLLKERRSISIKASEVAREAGIAASSFYLHYHSLTDVIIKNEKQILAGLDDIVDNQMKENSTIEKKLNNILLYLYRYRELLEIIGHTNNITFHINLMRHLHVLIERSCPNYCHPVKAGIYSLINAAFLAEFGMWWQEKFSIDHIPTHAKRMAYLTTNTPRFFAAIYFVDIK